MIDLTEDASILTAIANDIGVDEIFQRQVIAYGGIAVALSTSGNSANLIEALTEARRRRAATLAFVGYDGGGSPPSGWRPRGRDAVPAHPPHPGGPGERLPRPGRADPREE